MNPKNIEKILKYSEDKNWTTYFVGINFAHIIYALGLLFVVNFLNSFYDEGIMRSHILYKKRGRVYETYIIDMEECVLCERTGRRFYSVVNYNDGENIVRAKINRGEKDYIGRKIEVIKFGKGKFCVIRRQHEELYVTKFMQTNEGERWQKILQKTILKGVGVMALLAFLIGIQYIPKALALFSFILGIIYLIYPMNFIIRDILWKTKLTRK